MPRYVIVFTAVIIALHPGFSVAVNPARASGEALPLTIKGARVSTEAEAKKIATDTYFKETRGLRGVQTAKVVSIHTLDLDIKGFARKGDVVWEVRIYGPRDLEAVIWVHSASAKTYFLVPQD